MNRPNFSRFALTRQHSARWMTLLLASQFLLPLQAAEKPAANDDVPKGAITEHVFDQSKIFPGTTRTYWVYVPQQYNPVKPACVYVGQDGLNPRLKFTDVFDRLIAGHQMPVTVGIFVKPGSIPAPTPQAGPRVNRSFEYNSLGDDYARFCSRNCCPRSPGSRS